MHILASPEPYQYELYQNSSATQIEVIDGDIYIGGFREHVVGTDRVKTVCYWKNGVITDLSSDSYTHDPSSSYYDTYISGLYVEDDDV